MKTSKKYDAFIAFFEAFKEEVKDEVMNEVERALIDRYSVKKEYYSLKEVAHLTGLSVHAIKGRYRRSALAVVYEGQTPLIPADEVGRLLAKLERQRA